MRVDVKFSYIGEHLCIVYKDNPEERFHMLAPEKVYWSYLAGLFDGEGTFSISRHRGKSSNGNPYDSTAIRIEICNTDLILMEWLVKHFGGKYYTHRREKQQHKVAYYWRPAGRKNSENLLLGIIPYLVIKPERAKIALEYVRLPHNTQYDSPLAAKRKELMEKLQLLNKRGTSVETNTLNGVEPMIESDLIGDYESGAVVTQTP